MRLQRCGRRQTCRQHLLLSRRDVRDRLSVSELRKRNSVLRGGQDHDRGQIGDDQHDVLCDLRPGHRPHAAQHRAEQNADKSGEDGKLELHPEKSRGNQAGAVDLRRHIGEGAGNQHDHAERAGEIAAVPERQEVGHGIGAELAQVWPDQDRHQHKSAGPSEHPCQAVIAKQEQGAGHADEGRRRHPVSAGRHAVIESRDTSSGDVILRDLRCPRHHADNGVDGEGEENEQVAEDLVRNANLLENSEQEDESDEAAGISTVHLAQFLMKSEVLAEACVAMISSPQSSSAKPNSRSILSCCFANMNSMTTNTMSDPCAAM